MAQPISTPCVSVLVTVYNREKYLAACLDSILAQTFTDFELILVDDCSTDGSFKIAERYQTDSRVQLHRNKTNLGQFANRTRAAELARGRYIKYVDSDDLIYPHTLAIMVEAIEAHSDVAVALSHSLPEEVEPYPWKLLPADTWRKEFLGRGCLSCGPSAAIIRREKFFEVGGFKNWGVLNDTALWYDISARWPVLLLPPGLVWWRRHDSQAFTMDNAAMAYLEKGFALTMHSLSSPECPLSDIDREAAIARAKQHHARRLLALAFRRGKVGEARTLYNKSGLHLADLLDGFKCYR